jgi:hypothetical protein
VPPTTERVLQLIVKGEGMESEKKTYEWSGLGYYCGHHHRTFEAAMRCGRGIVRAWKRQGDWEAKHFNTDWDLACQMVAYGPTGLVIGGG